ncbi:MAG TPA: type IV pilus twitching motility protein PilT [Pyrinomonadaceae bacterium]|nr:type IV pilus twitching motility protein PilT [Pyrinomonadaceae bacterium]
MEKLNEYLQTLLSTFSYELHLEPNKNPYLVTSTGNTDVANSPILGTQISMMVFPLIPPDVKQQLPNKQEVEFVHPHSLGNFNFVVKKSSAGFNVTVRPMMADASQAKSEISNQRFANESPVVEESVIESNAPFLAAHTPFSAPIEEEIPAISKPKYSFENSSTNFEDTFGFNTQTPHSPQIEIEESPKIEFQSNYDAPEIEIIDVNDPEFTTTFSSTSTYEPPGRRDDFDNLNNNLYTENDYSPKQDTQAYGETYTNSYSQNQFLNETQNSQPLSSFKEESFTQTQVPAQPAIQTPPSQPVFTEETPAFEPTQQNPAMRKRMDALFHKMSEVGASDLHLSVSMPPMVRKDGKMMVLECNETTLTPSSIKELLSSIMPHKNQEEFSRRNDTDFAYEIAGLARFRANIFADRKGMGGVFRIIPTKILTAEQLGLSQAIMNLCNLSKGLVVVTGPTGSGKSTTLCAMVDSINKNREDHIITIEDPIEFTHENQKCLVNQREVGNHTDSFKDALRAALREDPDILLVGEMRDLETISIAIETAETGHLVFGTLHTTTAASTIDRIIDQFPADRQQQIRVMLSESLKGVIAQTLLPKKGGGRVAALEVLIVTPAISNLIREGKTFQIPSAMQTGKQNGMVMLNDALFALVQKGLVEPKDAYIKAVDKTGFESLLQRNGIRM